MLRHFLLNLKMHNSLNLRILSVLFLNVLHCYGNTSGDILVLLRNKLTGHAPTVLASTEQENIDKKGLTIDMKDNFGLPSQRWAIRAVEGPDDWMKNAVFIVSVRLSTEKGTFYVSLISYLFPQLA